MESKGFVVSKRGETMAGEDDTFLDRDGAWTGRLEEAQEFSTREAAESAARNLGGEAVWDRSGDTPPVKV